MFEHAGINARITAVLSTSENTQQNEHSFVCTLIFLVCKGKLEGACTFEGRPPTRKDPFKERSRILLTQENNQPRIPSPVLLAPSPVPSLCWYSGDKGWEGTLYGGVNLHSPTKLYIHKRTASQAPPFWPVLFAELVWRKQGLGRCAVGRMISNQTSLHTETQTFISARGQPTKASPSLALFALLVWKGERKRK